MHYKNCLIENREIRVFLSSTFSDMDEERSALIKTFDVLKMEANRHNVTLSVLDLRWGVTEEESRTGKVISICLNEIENSHPFFIGLLGNRYGYSPKMCEVEKNPELAERYPWIVKDIEKGLSITEMEMQYGALRNQENVDAMFYIKKPKDNEPDDDSRLSRLKMEIRSQNRFPVSDYDSIEDLCKKVEIAITKLIGKYFPEEDSSRLGHERIVQKAYMNSRHGHYVKKQTDFDRIDDFLKGSETHLVITGDSGVGKSALVANWIITESLRSSHSHFIIYHFVGNSFVDNGYEAILQHIADEICDLYCIEAPNHNESIERSTQQLLSSALSIRKPLLIVIDGINQIAEYSESKQLHWLPQHPNVKYLFSTTNDDETMATFKRRNYSTYRVTPLDEDQRREYIINYLSAVGKKLSEDQLSRIIFSQGKQNMLVLRSLLDELICFGSYERLDERINYYLSANTIKEFFKSLLKRLEMDYKAESKALSYIAFSERGLTEDEILGMCQLRKMDWHMLYCAIYNHLIIHNGYITFAHHQMTEAAQEYYDSAKTRQEIVNYFVSNAQVDKCHKVTELSYQYFHLNKIPQLYNTLLSLEAFDIFDSNESDRTHLARYWQKIFLSEDLEAQVDRRWDIPDEMSVAFFKKYYSDYLYHDTAYGRKYKLIDYLALPADDTSLKKLPYMRIGQFISKYLHGHNTALKYYIAQLAKTKNDYGDVFDEDKFLVLQKKDTQPKLETRILKFFKILTPEKIGYYNPEAADYYVRLYFSIGFSYYCLADYNQASYYIFRASAICHEMNPIDDTRIAEMSDCLGRIYNKVGDAKRAVPLFKKSLKIKMKKFGIDHPCLISSYLLLGEAYETRYKTEKASDYYTKAADLSISIHGEKHVETARCYVCLCRIGRDKRRYMNQREKIEIMDVSYNLGKKAIDILEEELGLMNEDTASAYHEFGLTQYIINSDDSYALESLSKALKAREHLLGKYHPDTAETNYYLGLIYENEGDYISAREYYQEALQGKMKLSFRNANMSSDRRHFGFHVDYWAAKQALKRLDDQKH